jgi:hypothetical protein
MTGPVAARTEPPGSSPAARLLGAACLGAAVLALSPSFPRRRDRSGGTVPAMLEDRSRPPERRHAIAPGMAKQDRAAPVARSLHHAAALLALSVLIDSAIEHYRGQFDNPGMFAPLATSLATTIVGARAPAAGNDGVYATAAAVGAAGIGFHLYNVGRRPGGFCWQNLFYAAPLGAPAALGLAGLFGLAARRIAAARPAQRLLGLPAGRVLAATAGLGMAGSSAEAALLHFRGAYHRPAMWLPVTLPPLAAAFLLRAAAGARDRLAGAWLNLTALVGTVGVAFHASGVARQMGGWRNWRQNLLSGPPLPAPPSFVALALAGRAALALANGRRA